MKGFTWLGAVSVGLAAFYMVSLRFIWFRCVLHGLGRSRLVSLCFAWFRCVLHGFAAFYMVWGESYTARNQDPIARTHNQEPTARN